MTTLKVTRIQNDGSRDSFICDPENFAVELVGWEIDSSDFDKEKDELEIFVTDTQK